MSVLIIAGGLLLVATWHRPGWVIFVALSVAALLDLFQIGVGGINLGISLYIDDAACLLVLGAGLLALKRYPKNFSYDAVPCLVLMALVALSFGRGISPFGLKAAGNSSRTLFTFVAPVLAVMLLWPVFQLDAGRLARWLGWAGFCLSGVALLRWGGVLPIPIELEDNVREVVRSLNSDYAFIVGLAFVAAIYLPLVERRSAWWWMGAGLLGAVTLALQHRSVWTATVVGLAWLVLRNARRVAPLRWLAVGAAGCIVLVVIVVAIPQTLESADAIVTTNAREVQSKHSTWAWRVSGYDEATTRLLDSDSLDMLVGPPAGWATDTDASFAARIIHSRYISTLACYGLVGFAVLLIWFGMFAKTIGSAAQLHRRRPSRNRPGTTFLEALFLSELVYMVPYTGGILEAAVLGLIWVAAKQNAIPIFARRLAYARNQFDRKNIPATLAT
jgi:hypothetical protein